MASSSGARPPIGPYIVDFVCFERKLVVEVDGGQHAIRTGEDGKRTAWLESRGFKVIRIWNNEALQNTDGAVEYILRHLIPAPLAGAG